MSKESSVPAKYRKLLRRYIQEYLAPVAGRKEFPVPKVTWESRLIAAAGWVAGHLALNGLEPGDEYEGSPELMRFAERCLDFFQKGWEEKDQLVPPNDHFGSTFHLQNYEMLRDRASREQRERWARAVEGHSAAAEERLRTKLSEHLERKSALELGCGPNHLYAWCSVLYRGGRVLDRTDYRERAKWAMHRLLEAQDRRGFHAEHRGPVIQYHTVTLGGMWDYYVQSGDRQCEAPLKRGAEFWCRWMYPDLTPIEVMDERNRWSANYGWSAHGALSTIPMGRRYVGLVLDKQLRDWEARKGGWERAAQGHPGWMLRALINYPGGAEAKLPIEQRKMVYRMDHEGLVRRRGPWVYALSAVCNEPWEYNPFILDRVANLSCWHEKTGLVIGGGNDKYAPEVATFYASEGGFVGYYRPRSGRIVTGADGSGDRVELDYGSIRAGFRVQAKDSKRLKIQADLRHWVVDLKPSFNLPLRIKPGSEVRLGTGDRVKLSRGTRITRTHETAGVIATDAWELKGPAGMRLRWPHFPFNSYRNERAVDMNAAVGIVTVPLADEGGQVELELRVR